MITRQDVLISVRNIIHIVCDFYVGQREIIEILSRLDKFYLILKFNISKTCCLYHLNIFSLINPYIISTHLLIYLPNKCL